MSAYLSLFLVVLMAILQSTIGVHVQVFGVVPDLALMWVVAWILVFGLRQGLLLSLVAGIILDALSATPFGLMVLAVVASSALAGFGQMNLFRTAWLLPYASAAIVTLAYGLLSIVLLQLGGRDLPWGALLVRVLLPEMLVNVVCMAPIYAAVSWLHRRSRPEAVEWQ